jgi:hypothetical protein
MESELVLSRGGLPPLSARGCTQELSPISLGNFQRTVNGDLIFLGVKGMKYRSLISCEDQTVFASDDLYPGMELEVSCIQLLWQESTQSRVMLERDPVPGSVMALDKDRQPIPILEQNNREITLAAEPCFICYRPLLKMRVISFGLVTNEWQKSNRWKLELEEI